MNRLKEWSRELIVIGSLLGTVAAGLAYMHAQHNGIRADMRAGFAELRDAMREEHTEIRAEMREEHAEMRDRLNSIDRRTSRIEGHLFGVEIAPEPADGE